MPVRNAMAMEVIHARGREQAVEHGTRVLASLGSLDTEATLVVASTKCAQARKEQLLAQKLSGIRVLTHGQWVRELWDVYGSGLNLVSPTQRRALARPLLAGVMGSAPSSRLLATFCSFVEEAVAASPYEGELFEHERKVLAAVDAYKEQLAENGLIEAATAEQQLGALEEPFGCVVVEGLIDAPVHVMRFYESISSVCNVTVVQRTITGKPTSPEEGGCVHEGKGELSELAAALYSGEGGMACQGQVYAGEAHGAHIEGELAVAMVQHALSSADAPQSVALVFANPQDSYPHIQESFAQAGIPFTCRFSLPFGSTPFGTAFLSLFKERAEADEDAGYRLLAGFVASAYSGIERADARALHIRWRARAGSVREQRWADIRDGFSQGNVTAADIRLRLEPLAKLYETDYEQAAACMFENARARYGAAALQLIDDAHALHALLDYIEQCSQVGHKPDLADIAAIGVSYERESASGAPIVHLIGAKDLALEEYPYVILANLDASHYPMACHPGPFDKLAAKIGVSKVDAQALRQRCMLLDALSAAQQGFGFYRVCHDQEGNECCQSALWDELLDAYRPKADANLSSGGVLDAFAHVGSLIRISEAQLFINRAENEQFTSVVRGKLADGKSGAHLANFPTGAPIPFSPTALEDYYRCPYRWFTSRRVGYNGMDNAFTAAAQGNLAHNFFQEFYLKLREQGYERVDEGNLDESLATADAVFDALLEKRIASPKTGLFLKNELDRLNCESIREQVKGLLRRDAQFLPGFKPTYLELELGRGTGNTLMYAGVPVRGKVDRIDTDASGRAVIIDYKLSSLSVGYGLKPAEQVPLRIQTDIYATLVQRHFSSLGIDLNVVGSVYRSYAHNALRGVYDSGLNWGAAENVKQKTDALPNSSLALSYAEYLETVEETVAECMERLAGGDIQPRPIARGVCEYCKAYQFCPNRE